MKRAKRTLEEILKNKNSPKVLATGLGSKKKFTESQIFSTLNMRSDVFYIEQNLTERYKSLPELVELCKPFEGMFDKMIIGTDFPDSQIDEEHLDLVDKKVLHSLG